MSPPEKSRNTIKSTSSQASEGSPSPSKCVTLGEVAAYARRVFHARICQPPVKVQGLKEKPVDSGGKPLQPLAGYDQMSSSWRTCQPSLLEESEPFSGRWPRSGIVSSGIAYLLPTLARRTDVIESGLSGQGMLWPTPRGTKGWGAGGLDGGSNSRAAAKARGMWPTPKSQVSGPDYARVNRPRSGGDDLATSVARTRWPTPIVGDAEKCPSESLSRAVRPDLPFSHWPTPSTRDHKGGYQGGRIRNDNQAKTGGQLSADWVSILMGYSLDWTTIAEDGNAESPESPRGKKTEPKD